MERRDGLCDETRGQRVKPVWFRVFSSRQAAGDYEAGLKEKLWAKDLRGVRNMVAGFRADVSEVDGVRLSKLLAWDLGDLP